MSDELERAQERIKELAISLVSALEHVDKTATNTALTIERMSDLRAEISTMTASFDQRAVELMGSVRQAVKAMPPDVAKEVMDKLNSGVTTAVKNSVKPLEEAAQAAQRVIAALENSVKLEAWQLLVAAFAVSLVSGTASALLVHWLAH
jgi:hypothetical protein